MEGFEEKKGFPRVVGALDGSHIPIKVPPHDEDPGAYKNRKKQYSIVLQVSREHTIFEIKNMCTICKLYNNWPESPSIFPRM